MDRYYFDGYFQPTLQPTECDVLYDFRVLWQSQRLTGTRLIARVHSGLPLLLWFSFERYPVRLPLFQPEGQPEMCPTTGYFDTVEVCGSSPHGPTISFNELASTTSICKAPIGSIKGVVRNCSRAVNRPCAWGTSSEVSSH